MNYAQSAKLNTGLVFAKDFDQISNPLLTERSMNSRIKVLDCSQVLKLLNSNEYKSSPVIFNYFYGRLHQSSFAALSHAYLNGQRPYYLFILLLNVFTLCS